MEQNRGEIIINTFTQRRVRWNERQTKNWDIFRRRTTRQLIVVMYGHLKPIWRRVWPMARGDKGDRAVTLSSLWVLILRIRLSSYARYPDHQRAILLGCFYDRLKFVCHIPVKKIAWFGKKLNLTWRLFRAIVTDYLGPLSYYFLVHYKGIVM
jgi:hypothetical protein